MNRPTLLHRARRFTALAWLFAAALLLKAAMPLVASASAQAQGKALVEVCTVYGVALVPLDVPARDVPAPAAAHEPPCALSMLADGGTATTAPSVPAPPRTAAPDRVDGPSRTAPHDAAARWLARLRHAPPAG